MKKELLLFDVDGVLIKPQSKITQETLQLLEKLKEKYDLGFVGGSDISNQKRDIGDEHIFKLFKWGFSQNGTTAFENGELFHKTSIVEFLGEEKCQNFINTTLKELSKVKVPKKRGFFIDLRTGMINVSPIGRNCSYEEREEFFEFDKEEKVREKIIKELKPLTDELNLDVVIGGMISFEMFPKGWDKTYCLQFIEDKYDTIYFFGDKCYEGGNDYTIYHDKRTQGFWVKNFNETMKILKEKFL